MLRVLETFSAILILFALVLALGRWHEENSLFHPTGEHTATPSDFALSPHEFFIDAGNRKEKIHAWHFIQDVKASTILYAHGNAGNISDRLDVIKGYVDNGFNVFIYDPRGYGKSGGRPSRKNFVEDAIAAYDFLTGECGVDAEKLVILGQSLGSIPAIRLGVSRKSRAVILEGAFHSVRQMAKDIFGPVPIWILASSDYDNAREIVKLKIPVLIIHGTEDAVVPFHNSGMLYKLAHEPKELLRVEGSGHTEMYSTAPGLYFGTIKRFVEKGSAS